MTSFSPNDSLVEECAVGAISEPQVGDGRRTDIGRRMECRMGYSRYKGALKPCRATVEMANTSRIYIRGNVLESDYNNSLTEVGNVMLYFLQI